MKKKLLLTIVLMLVNTLFSVFVFAKQKENIYFPVIIDHMNVRNGEQIPEWVTDIIDFNYDSAKKKLGIKDTDMIFINYQSNDSLENLLLEGKILSFVEFIKSVKIKINMKAKQEYMDNELVKFSPLYEETSFFGCRTITECVYSDGQIQKIEYYYMTPFGIMQGALYLDESNSFFTKKNNVIKIDIMSNGKLICPSEFENFFKWFRNDENVQINQFWTKTQITDNSEKYNCITVMSMSKENYEKILKMLLE